MLCQSFMACKGVLLPKADCVTAGISTFIAQSLKDKKGRMTLLLVNATVALQNSINPCGMHFELLRSRPLTSSVTRWN